MSPDAAKFAAIVAGWGWNLPRGAVAQVEVLCQQLRGERPLTTKELAADLGWPASKLYSMRAYASAIGDPVFVGGSASRGEVTAWLKRHPEFKVSWRRPRRPRDTKRHKVSE